MRAEGLLALGNECMNYSKNRVASRKWPRPHTLHEETTSSVNGAIRYRDPSRMHPKADEENLDRSQSRAIMDAQSRACQERNKSIKTCAPRYQDFLRCSKDGRFVR